MIMINYIFILKISVETGESGDHQYIYIYIYILIYISIIIYWEITSDG